MIKIVFILRRGPDVLLKKNTTLYVQCNILDGLVIDWARALAVMISLKVTIEQALHKNVKAE